MLERAPPVSESVIYILGSHSSIKQGGEQMKRETKNKLLEAWKYCDENNKSSEFMLEYMQSAAGVNLDCVLNFIMKTAAKQIREENQ